MPAGRAARNLRPRAEGRIENALALGDAYRGTAHLLGELLSSSHEYTGAHSRSVVILAHEVGEAMGVPENVLREIEFGALLHDVGKMAVPNEILNKPSSLTEDEWAQMRRHTAEGERMLARIGGVLAEVGTVIRSHHERFDGSGYPDGLRRGHPAGGAGDLVLRRVQRHDNRPPVSPGA